MSFRRWQREWLLDLARQLRISVHLAATDREIVEQIAESAVTEQQTKQLTVLFERLRREMPPELNYGRAADIIELGAEILNKAAIDAFNMVPGQVYRWNERYFLVNNMLGASKAYKVFLQEVTLSRAEGQTRLQPKGNARPFHPASMQFVATVVDLDNWDPNDTIAPKAPPKPQQNDNPF